MGNSGSSNNNNSTVHEQHCTSGNQEIGRGWTHSFPRELTRHHSQPPGHKVLPEPPNQRLRATNNGSIIHNGGTISGRRPAALTLPHDLNKQAIYRSRSTSASNLCPRSRSIEPHQSPHHCCFYRSGDPRFRESEISELKRFGSEPDLRYAPNDHHYQEATRHSGYYPERESRERESRYRGKKKYKAPAPPATNCGVDDSSPDTYKWDIANERDDGCCRPEDDTIVQPPPRRSRLFKTRAETKKAQTNWNSGLFSQHENESLIIENEREWRNDNKNITEKDNRSSWRENSDHDGRWCDRNERRGSKKFDGKNTLQRSLSSPEFQAELMQVARKVRNKLNYNKRIGPVGASTPICMDQKSEINENQKASSTSELHRDRQSNRKNDRTRLDDGHVMYRNNEKRKTKNFEESYNERRGEDIRSSARFNHERRSQNNVRDGNRVSKSQQQEIRESDDKRINESSRDRSRAKEREENRLSEMNNAGGHRRRIVEKSYTYEEKITTNGTNDFVSGRKSLNERLEILGFSLDERLDSDRQRHHREEERNNIDARERQHQQQQQYTGPRNRKNEAAANIDGPTRTRSESPAAIRNSRDRMDVRGQGSGRESTPEPTPQQNENKINADQRKRRNDTRDDNYMHNDKRWSERNMKMNLEKMEFKSTEKKKNLTTQQTTEDNAKNWNRLPPTGKTQHKTYFNGDDGLSREIRTNGEQQQQRDHLQSKMQGRDRHNLSNSLQHRITDDKKNQNSVDDIALKLRPTLPKKQLEIPRFSPSAAWRLLSALESPGPTMSTASEEVPVMFEERIERLARPPPPLVALGPRSSHDKSGDSGISGDAGAANDDSLDVSTTLNRVKTPATRPAWTPQQDLGEESSSDAGVDSPPPMMPPSMKFPPRAHVFSLSLPRDNDDNRHSSAIYNVDTKNTKHDNISSFHSLQKLKRSVTGALGLVANDIDTVRKRPGDSLGENWLLSSSAPNSLQHSQVNQIDSTGNASPNCWDNNYHVEDIDDDEAADLEDNEEDKIDFPMVMKPPSFSYLASGGHVMYLPGESNDNERATQSLNYRNSADNTATNIGNFKYKRNPDDTKIMLNKIGSFGINGISINNNTGTRTDSSRDARIYRERSFTDLATNKTRKYPNFFKSCENISEMRQRSVSPINAGPENLQDLKGINGNNNNNNNKTTTKNSKGKRFTFQSTVRQIERRRLAEKLSREAEAKERQRKSELEVMRKVEEEFQRKRAREKANIRQQLRLYSMDVNSSSLPPTWDSSQVSRADPDGAPSSSASSPTSGPLEKMSNNRNSSIVGSDEYQHRKRVSECRAQQQQQQPAQHREYKDYRPKYYDWAPESSSHLEVKQTTIHPKVVYDIPKSNSHVFVDANIHTAKPANVTSTPRSDNYRKDFAHGAVAARSSLASSDSELSQPNTRPHSRQNTNKNKPVRSRSVSPERSDEAGSAEEESPVEAVKHERNAAINGFALNGVQPFVRDKSYRPIAFNPRPPPPVPS